MDSIAQKMKRAAALMAALAAIVAAVMKALFGGSWSELKHDVRRHAKAAKEMAGFAGDGAAAVGRGAGHVLSGPLRALDLTASAVGQTLGALLPHAPVTARAVADGAVARDDARTHRVDSEMAAAHDGLVAANLVGIKIQGAANSLISRGGPLHAIYSDELTPTVRAWLEGLSPAQLKRVVDAPAHALDRHLNADAQTDLIPGLPRVLSTTARLAKEANGGELDMAGMLAQAKANLRNSGAEAEAMMTRGTFRRPPEEPEGGQVIPIRGPRPTPQPSFG